MALSFVNRSALPFNPDAETKVRALVSACFLAWLILSLQLLHAFPAQNPDYGKASSQSPGRDGQHDFDFAIGTWKTHLSRLQHPLTGSNTWIEYDGSSVVRKVGDGRASLEEFEANGSVGHVEGLILLLYNPESHQWSQSWATSGDGTLGPPMIGEFKNGRGEFVDHETYNDRAIYVRWVWSDITPNSCRFEQSFSEDGGKTWEANWISEYSRVIENAGQTR